MVGLEEHVRRVLACRELIWAVATEFLTRGTDVIIDDGLFLREDRRRYIEMTKSLGAEPRLHFLDARAEILRDRIERRNAALPRYNFLIDPHLFDRFAGLFEVPTQEEGAALVVVDGAQRPTGP